MRLSDEIVEKFNRYFKEMLEYYDLSNIRLYTDKFNGLEVFNVSELANKIGVGLPDNRNETQIQFIGSNYPGLTPFYKLYLTYYNRSFSKSACQMYLKNINENMKLIREAKQEVNNLVTTNPCAEIPLQPVFRKRVVF